MAGNTEQAAGRDADKPTEIPMAGWKSIGKRAMGEVKNDNVGLMAAGVAFYFFLALFPALIAMITVYGLVTSPDQLQQQIDGLTSALPDDAASIITDQMQSIASPDSGGLTAGLVVSLVGALWAASGGMMGLIKGINAAYDERETRNFFVKRGLAILLTLGGIVFFAVAVGLVAVVPAVLGTLGLGSVGQTLANILRWPLLAVMLIVALAIIYRLAPNRDNPRFQWASLGAVIATVLWLIGSALFSFYVSNFGSYNETYGALAGVIILLLWLFLTAFVILVGAELNSEMEHQTARDTTTGEPRPMGRRDARMADTVAKDSES